ncbi:MAG: alpha-amylase family glycosyl hydrolase [Niabella sp.]
MKRFLLLALSISLFAACKKNDKPSPTPPVVPEEVTETGLVVSNKYFPTSEEALTLTFDPMKGNKGLSGFTGDIYLYAGVITDKSSSLHDWKYVKSPSFSEADPASKMTRQSSGKYSIALTPRTFFGVPASEKIQKIVMVFRKADGDNTAVGRNADGSDIYLSLYNSGDLNLRFIEPEMTPTDVPHPVTSVVNIGQEIAVTAVASQKTNLTLTLNNTQVATASNSTQLTGKVKITTSGPQTIRISTATGVSTSFTLTANGEVKEAALPAGAKQNGVTFINNGTSAIFALYAPQKSFAYVVGDFTNWTMDEKAFMKRTPDKKTWWVQIDGLNPSTEYAYQFWVDGSLKIADPYCEKVLDPSYDPYIPAANNTDIGTYPTGKTSGIVSTIKANAANYNWTAGNFSRPAKTDLVIYELLLRDFMAANNYKTLTDTIPYLKRLGVNAVELLPVNEFEGNSSWGYNPSFYFAPDKYYGNKMALQRFIDECHKQGIAVILDVVFNHATSQSPMVQLYFDQQNNRPAANNPWFNVQAPHSALTFYNDFNHESAATKLFVKDVLKFWIDEYKIDGYRFDFSKGFTQKATTTLDAAGAYDASRIAILKDYNNYIKSIDPNAYVILEHFCADAEEKELAAEGMMLWNNLNYNFNEASMGWLTNANFSRAMYGTHGFPKADGLVTYMESHDEERMMFKNITYGNSNGSYNIKSLATALKRQEMCAAFLFAIPGPKMLWQFGELGYDISIDQNGRTGDKPVLWTYNTQPERVNLRDAFSKFIRLKKNNTVFKTTATPVYDFTGAVKYIKLQEGSQTVVIVGNFDVIPQAASIDFGTSGTWYDAANNNQSVTLPAQYAQILQPGEYHIYSINVLQE